MRRLDARGLGRRRLGGDRLGRGRRRRLGEGRAVEVRGMEGERVWVDGCDLSDEESLYYAVMCSVGVNR